MSNIFHNISDYLLAKEYWEMIPAKINSKGMFLFINGKWVKGNIPKPQYSPYPKCNPDGTKIENGVIIKKYR